MITEAVIYSKKGQKLKLEKIEIPKPKNDEVIIKIVSSGICHSQLINLSRDPRQPELLGHEATGIVQEKGRMVKHVNTGDRVLISWMPHFENKNLNKDYFKPVNIFYKKKPLQAFIFTWAKKTLINSQFVTKLPKDLDMYDTSIIGCAGIAGYGTVLNTVNIQKKQSVVVYGAGGLGLLAINAAKNLGAKPIIAIDINKKKLTFSKKFGADYAILSNKNLKKTIMKITKNKGIDYIFDMVGSNETLENSIDILKTCIPGNSRGGSIVLVGFPNQKFELNTRNILMAEQKIIGSRGGSCVPKRDFKKFYKDYRSGKMMLKKIVTKKYSLHQINKAVNDLSKGKILGRAIIKIS